MNAVPLLLFTLVFACAPVNAGIESKAKEFDKDNNGIPESRVEIVKRHGKEIYSKVEQFNTDGTLKDCTIVLRMGKPLVIITDKPGTPQFDSIYISDPVSKNFEQFTITENHDWIPFSEEEKRQAQFAGELVTDLLQGDVSRTKIRLFMVRMWLQRWQPSMLFTLGVVAMVAFCAGRGVYRPNTTLGSTPVNSVQPPKDAID